MKLVYVNRSPKQIFETLLKKGMLPFNSEAKKEYFEKQPYDGLSINALSLFTSQIPLEQNVNDVDDEFAVADVGVTFKTPPMFKGQIKHEQEHSTTDSWSMSGYEFGTTWLGLDHVSEFYPLEGIVWWNDLDDENANFTWITNRRNKITCHQNGYNTIIEITSWKHDYEAASPRLVSHILEKLDELTDWD